MIECIEELNQFVADSRDGDWIIYIVPIENSRHPSQCHPSIFFIKNILTKKYYWLAENHPDSRPTSDVIVKFKQYIKENNNKKWTINKKQIHQLYPTISNVLDVNIKSYLHNNTIILIDEFETQCHRGLSQYNNSTISVNKSIPLMKHLELFMDVCDRIEQIINIQNLSIADGFFFFNDIVYPTFATLELAGVCVDIDKFTTRFGYSPIKNLVYTEYNIFTSTGRPSNRYGNINYAALSTKDNTRDCFVSRFGKDGQIFVIDYTSFHPRLLCYLLQYDIPVEINIYEYLAKLYFQKQIIDEEDIKNAKQITFFQLYGNVDEKYSHIKYLSNLKKFINFQWEFFNENGYINTPIFQRKITKSHITDPNPAKIFNYILQALEGEIVIPVLNQVQRYLQTLHTKAILYTYDAIVYDYCKLDGNDVLDNIKSIMSCNNKFPLKSYIGDSYQNLKLID